MKVEELFMKHGHVFKAKLLINHRTGLPRGYGFVEMEAPDAAIAVTFLNGKTFGGRQIKVNLSKISDIERAEHHFRDRISEIPERPRAPYSRSSGRESSGRESSVREGSGRERTGREDSGRERSGRERRSYEQLGSSSSYRRENPSDSQSGSDRHGHRYEDERSLRITAPSSTSHRTVISTGKIEDDRRRSGYEEDSRRYDDSRRYEGESRRYEDNDRRYDDMRSSSRRSESSSSKQSSGSRHTQRFEPYPST